MRGKERANKVVFTGRIPAVVSRGPKHEWAMSGCTLVITETANLRLASIYRAMATGKAA